MSEDYGQTWESIKANIPYGPVNIIREDPKDENILYVGTDYGVFISMNRGVSWETLVGDLPTTYVHDINIHPRDDIAVIATHGRGMWALDVQMVREVIKIETSDVAAGIFDIPAAELPYNKVYYKRTVKKLNAPFYLKEAGSVGIKVINTDGNVVFENNRDSRKGLNYAEWGLLDANEEIIKTGTYTLQIKGIAFEESKEFEVKPFSRW